MASGGTAAAHWAQELESWAIPAEILSAAPESPWGFPPALFGAREVAPDTPSRRRACESLAPGGSVLDVGAGGGAACLALVPPASEVTAVDESGTMLVSLEATASARGVRARTIEGRWPDVAGLVGPADVVVCHHVLYNVADAAPFVTALSAHARRRVVVEMTAVHPLVALNRLWRHFHGTERPQGPGVDDAVAVVEEAGIHPHVERFTRPPLWSAADRPSYVAFVRRRLCLTAGADAEIDEMIDPVSDMAPTPTACLWWDAG